MTLRFDLRINQGETFQVAVPVFLPNGDEADLSGSTARGQIRSHAAAPTALYGNEVVLSVPAADSSAWAWRTGAYDVEITDTAGNITRLVEGYVVVHPDVTR
jgi:hypothetical protein